MKTTIKRCVTVAALTCLIAQAVQAESAWVWSAALEGKIGRISNLDFVTDDNDVPDFADSDAQTIAGRDSFFTSYKPEITLTNRAVPWLNLFGQYSVDVQTPEDKQADRRLWHFGNLILDGKFGSNVSYFAQSVHLRVDGNDEAPVFGSPFGVPATTSVEGNLPLAVARDAYYNFHTGHIRFQLGSWFLRPNITAKVDDFRTNEGDATPLEGDISATDTFLAFNNAFNPLLTPFEQGVAAGTFLDAVGFRENLIDRRDLNFGIDIGYRIAANTDLVFGFKFGQQDQENNPAIISAELAEEAAAQAAGVLFFDPADTFGLAALFNAQSEAFGSLFSNANSSNRYERYTIGIEGSPARWVDLNVHAGFDNREYDPRSQDQIPDVSQGFDLEDGRPFVRGTINLRPTVKDKIDINLDWFEQPAFAGFRVFEDIRADLLYSRALTRRLSGFFRFTFFEARFDDDQLDRRDQMITYRSGFNYKFTRSFNVTAEVEHIDGQELEGTPANNIFAAIATVAGGPNSVGDLPNGETTRVFISARYNF